MKQGVVLILLIISKTYWVNSAWNALFSDIYLFRPSRVQLAGHLLQTANWILNTLAFVVFFMKPYWLENTELTCLLGSLLCLIHSNQLGDTRWYHCAIRTLEAWKLQLRLLSPTSDGTCSEYLLRKWVQWVICAWCLTKMFSTLVYYIYVYYIINYRWQLSKAWGILLTDRNWVASRKTTAQSHTAEQQQSRDSHWIYLDSSLLLSCHGSKWSFLSREHLLPCLLLNMSCFSLMERIREGRDHV